MQGYGRAGSVELIRHRHRPRNQQGVDPRVAGRIFGQGFSTKRDTTGFGRGYGLDLVRRTVTSRGGTIEVGPSALGGARFAFEMERV